MELTFAGLLVVVVLAWVLGRGYRWLRRWWRPRRPAPDVSDAAQQLAFVSRVAFERQPLLNKSEFQVLLLLESVIRDMRAGHRVMAQTNLGEFLRPKRETYAVRNTNLAFRSINSKRADFVILDRRGLAILAVEYQGHGHYQGNATMRDAVKREVFRSAGIALVEVPARYEGHAIARQVRGILVAYEKTNSATA